MNAAVIIILSRAIFMAISINAWLKHHLLLFLILKSLSFAKGVCHFGGRVVEDVVDVGTVAVHELAHLRFIYKTNIIIRNLSKIN